MCSKRQNVNINCRSLILEHLVYPIELNRTTRRLGKKPVQFDQIVEYGNCTTMVINNNKSLIMYCECLSILCYSRKFLSRMFSLFTILGIVQL